MSPEPKRGAGRGATRGRGALDVQPLTPDRWADLEALFGPHGACAGCWCMWWRLTRREFDQKTGAPNKRAFRKLVTAGKVPGILAYADGEPVGWCAIEPRASYPVLQRSPVLKPVDEQPVWSITCLFVARSWRRRGVSVKLIRAAVRHAARLGAVIVEGYPKEPRTDAMPDYSAFTGLPAAFREAGFTEVLRRSATRPIMRYRVPRDHGKHARGQH
ncbi:MAG: GNAT family N-acetyltransferase [Planctomycetota bacterium]|jgi:GNAT superfamily N-acetyltransferase